MKRQALSLERFNVAQLPPNAFAIVMATGIVLSKRWPSPAPLLATTGWQLVAGGLVAAPVALAGEGPPPATRTAGHHAG